MNGSESFMSFHFSSPRRINFHINWVPTNHVIKCKTGMLNSFQKEKGGILFVRLTRKVSHKVGHREYKLKNMVSGNTMEML